MPLSEQEQRHALVIGCSFCCSSLIDSQLTDCLSVCLSLPARFSVQRVARTRTKNIQPLFVKLKFSFCVLLCFFFLRGCMHPAMGFLFAQQEVSRLIFYYTMDHSVPFNVASNRHLPYHVHYHNHSASMLASASGMLC